MKIMLFCLIMFALVSGTGCGKESQTEVQETNPKAQELIDFEMTVEKVEELKGVILKGAAISGVVMKGCISNDINYAVHRNDEQVFEGPARILNISKQDGTHYVTGEAAVTGDYVHLYIPDVNSEEFKTGDVASAKVASCESSASEG